MFSKRNCVFMALVLAALVCAKGCSIPFRSPEVKDGKLYGVTKGTFRHRWWHYYERGLSFADGDFFEQAELDLREAISQRENDKWRARTYGMHFINYFPHCELGVIRYKQGDLESAVQELATALKTAKNAKAEYYLDLARKDLIERDGSDKKRPEIIIESPKSEHPVNDFFTDIRGIAKDDTFVRHIRVNGKEIRIDVSEKIIPFYMRVALAPGKNIIPIEATDLTGKTSQSNVIVHADRIGPVISIKGVKGKGQGDVLLRGYAFDDSGLSELMVGDRKFFFDGQKAIQIQETIHLRPGETVPDIKVKDAPGNVTSAKIDLSEGDEEKVLSGLLAQNSGDEEIGSDIPERILVQPASSATEPLVIELSRPEDRSTYLDYAVVDGKVVGDVEYLVAVNDVKVDGKVIATKKYAPLNGGRLPEIQARVFYFNFVIDLEKNEDAENFIEIQAQGHGYSDTARITIKWREHIARRPESRLKIAVSDFRRSGEVSASGFEDNLVAAMRAGGRFGEAEHRSMDHSMSEKERCDMAKQGGFHCMLFGHIEKRADKSEHINVWLRDADDKEYLLKNADVYGYSSESLVKVMNLKITDELPLLEGIVQEKPKEDWITVNFGEENKVKKGMDIIVYELGEVIAGFEDTAYQEAKELGEAKIRAIQKEKSLARLIRPEDKEKKKKIRPRHNVITR